MKRARAEILSVRKVGGYHSLTIVAPEIAERARPGHFISIRMPEEREFLLRRHLFIHQASRRGGWAGTLELAFDACGPGTSWLSQARVHRFLDVIGPLGRPFSYPKHLTNCLLVAEGHGAAPLYFLAQELLARHRRVDMVVGGSSQDAIFKPVEAKRLAQTVSIVTNDGSLGVRGSVVDALEEAVERSEAEVVYAAASPRSLEGIAAFCGERRLPSQVAVEERMGCGVGLCFSCVVPIVRGVGGGYEHQRACIDGPVFDPATIAWGEWLVPQAPSHTPAAPRSGQAAGTRP